MAQKTWKKNVQKEPDHQEFSCETASTRDGYTNNAEGDNFDRVSPIDKEPQ